MEEKLIFHVDMNSFFASCEQVVKPELKHKPIAVVGDASKRSGIVLAASYEAKAYGVKTTMPIFQALRCLPSLILVSSTYGLYSKMSKDVMGILDLYSPYKEQLSIDEAFLDMTGTKSLFGEPQIAAQKIMGQLDHELGLGCSIGISNNKLLAKMASDMKKPKGITTLFPSELEEKFYPLPVGTLYGVGKKSVTTLHELGIKTIKDLRDTHLDVLQKYFGDKQGKYMYESSRGLGSDQLLKEGEATVKSVGNELTYAKDLTDVEEIKKEVLLLADTVGYRMRKKLLKGRTLHIKIKYLDFDVITRSITFPELTDSTDFIFEEAYKLILEHRTNKPIRLIGISMSHFDMDDGQQLSLFNKPKEVTERKIDRMVDSLRDRFGYQSIHRASIIDKSHSKHDE